MSFHDVLFPVTISRGSSGGPHIRTTTVKLDSGQSVINARWPSPIYEYDVAMGVSSIDQILEVQRFYNARMGNANSFRFLDHADHTSHPTNPSYQAAPGTRDQLMQPPAGNGSNTIFYLYKRYSSGSNSTYRRILLPVQGTLQVWVNGVLRTEGVHYTVNYFTGAVTFTAGNIPANGHAVEWSGKFHVRVRFAMDDGAAIQASIDGWDVSGIRQIPLIEDIDASLPYVSEYLYGGAVERSISAGITIDTSAYLWTLSPTTTGLWAQLPDPTNMPSGGDYFTIINGGASSMTVRNQSGTTIATLAGGASCRIVLSEGVSKTWYALGA